MTLCFQLARGLFTYNEYSHYLYEKGCDDGVEIGVKAIVSPGRLYPFVSVSQLMFT